MREVGEYQDEAMKSTSENPAGDAENSWNADLVVTHQRVSERDSTVAESPDVEDPRIQQTSPLGRFFILRAVSR